MVGSHKSAQRRIAGRRGPESRGPKLVWANPWISTCSAALPARARQLTRQAEDRGVTSTRSSFPQDSARTGNVPPEGTNRGRAEVEARLARSTESSPPRRRIQTEVRRDRVSTGVVRPNRSGHYAQASDRARTAAAGNQPVRARGRRRRASAVACRRDRGTQRGRRRDRRRGSRGRGREQRPRANESSGHAKPPPRPPPAGGTAQARHADAPRSQAGLLRGMGGRHEQRGPQLDPPARKQDVDQPGQPPPPPDGDHARARVVTRWCNRDPRCRNPALEAAAPNPQARAPAEPRPLRATASAEPRPVQRRGHRLGTVDHRQSRHRRDR